MMMAVCTSRVNHHLHVRVEKLDTVKKEFKGSVKKRSVMTKIMVVVLNINI